MPEKITSKRVGDIGKPKPLFVHGKLLSVEVEYRKWADDALDASGKPMYDDNKKKIKVEGTGGVVSYAEWVKLPQQKRGQKWFIYVDQRMFHPDWETPTTRSLMVEFDDWNTIFLPGVSDMIGTAEKVVEIFVDRAADESWYVEAELVFTGYYNEKPQNTFHFVRMTQDENVVREWHWERYPVQEQTIPEDVVNTSKLLFEKMAKRNLDKFKTLVNGNEDLSPYLVPLAKLAETW